MTFAWCVAVLLIALVWVQVRNQIETQRVERLRHAELSLSNLSRLAQEHAASTLRAADQALRFVVARYQHLGEATDLRAMVEQGELDASVFNQVGVIDAQGIYRLGNLPITGRVDLSDREHFKVHVQQDSGQLFVSRPVQGRVSGKWSLQLTRRINRPDGSFGGVAVVSVDPAYFNRFYDQIDVGATGFVALNGLDGVIRARRAAGNVAPGGSVATSPTLAMLAHGQEQGFHEVRSPVDGVRRLVYFRKVPELPLFIAMGFGAEEVMAPYRAARRVALVQGTVISALLMSLALAFTVYQIRVQQARTRVELSEQRLRQISDRVPGVVYQYRMDVQGRGHFPYMSQGCQELLHLSPDEAAADETKVFGKVHPDDLQGLLAVTYESRVLALKGASPKRHHEFRMLDDVGAERWLSLDSVPRLQPDGSVLWTGHLLDITERKRAAHQLAESEQRMELALAGADLGMWDWYLNTGMFTFNERMETLLGYGPNELKVTNEAVMSMIHPQDVAHLRSALYPHLKGETPRFELECRLRDKLGQWRWFMARGKVVERDASGRAVRMVGTNLDVTERRRADDALRESESRFRSLTELSSDWFWEQDADFRFVRVQGHLEETTGITDEAHVGKRRWDFPALNLTEADWERHRAMLMAHQEFRHFEMRRPDHAGRQHWVSISGTPVFDAAGEFCGYRGVGRDITADKQAAEELRIAATAFEAQEGMMVTDAGHRILKVNRGFTDITGYEAHEVVGHTPRMLSSGRHDRAFFVSFWDAVTRTGTWQGEIWNRRKSGDVYPEWLTVTAVANAHGEVTHYVGAFTDLSQRKAAEEEIRRLAFYDPLTLLPNRRLMIDRLQQALAGSVRSQRDVALMFIDLDHFKRLNDSLGHDMGDRLLQQVAHRLQACVREGDTVARQGGDEFVVLLLGLSAQPRDAAAQARAVAEKMLVTLAQPYDLGGTFYQCTLSIGIALQGQRQSSVGELFKQADSAMYRAKEAGRNAVHVFEPALDAGDAADIEVAGARLS